MGLGIVVEYLFRVNLKTTKEVNFIVKKNNMKIAIIGSGDLAVQITHYIESYLNDEVVGFFDDFVS